MWFLSVLVQSPEASVKKWHTHSCLPCRAHTVPFVTEKKWTQRLGRRWFTFGFRWNESSYWREFRHHRSWNRKQCTRELCYPGWRCLAWDPGGCQPFPVILELQMMHRSAEFEVEFCLLKTSSLPWWAKPWAWPQPRASEDIAAPIEIASRLMDGRLWRTCTFWLIHLPVRPVVDVLSLSPV